MNDASWATADLSDAGGPEVQVVEGRYVDYGGSRKFCGPVVTLRIREDAASVLRELDEPGLGRVLVVDGGGSMRCALVGERLLRVAASNGWAAIVVHGAVRDAALTAAIPVGLRALGTSPRRGESAAESARGEVLHFAGVQFTPGAWLWADADGMVVTPDSSGAPQASR
ncbi:MAG: ribonuclease E activity regulator RraA [Gemmatimonadota bacterium]